MKPRLLNGDPLQPKRPRRPLSKTTLWRALAVGAGTLVLLVIYYLLTGYGFVMPVMLTYVLIPAVLLIAYLIYNRGLVYKNVTPDMLPTEWDEEKKRALLEDSRKRAERSKWLLAVMIPFVLVLMADVMYIFVWGDLIKPMLERLTAA